MYTATPLWHPSVADLFLPPETIPSYTPVIAIARVSTSKQKSNLPAQIGHLINSLTIANLSPQAIHSYVGSGHDPPYHEWLIAIRKRYTTPYLVAEHPDRFLRHPDFGPKNLSIQPTVEQYRKLKNLCQENDIKLATIFALDTPFHKIQSLRIGRGKKLHGSTLRMYQNNRRSLLLPIVARMREQGCSYGEIAENLYLPYELVKQWIRRACTPLKMELSGE